MLKTKISLKNFFIFNSTFCPREGEVRTTVEVQISFFKKKFFKFQDEKKVLFFYNNPVIDTNEKLKDVGFIEALIKFTGSLSFEENQPKDVLTIKTSKTMKFFFEPEKDFWVVLVREAI